LRGGATCRTRHLLELESVWERPRARVARCVACLSPCLVGPPSFRARMAVPWGDVLRDGRQARWNLAETGGVRRVRAPSLGPGIAYPFGTWSAEGGVQRGLAGTLPRQEEYCGYTPEHLAGRKTRVEPGLRKGEYSEEEYLLEPCRDRRSTAGTRLSIWPGVRPVWNLVCGRGSTARKRVSCAPGLLIVAGGVGGPRSGPKAVLRAWAVQSQVAWEVLSALTASPAGPVGLRGDATCRTRHLLELESVW
jgi:hypothetical protein